VQEGTVFFLQLFAANAPVEDINDCGFDDLPSFQLRGKILRNKGCAEYFGGCLADCCVDFVLIVGVANVR
jgi:hypothetical protein